MAAIDKMLERLRVESIDLLLLLKRLETVLYCCGS